MGKVEKRTMLPADWSRGKIRYHLEQEGHRDFTTLERKLKIREGTISDACRWPNLQGEEVIAKAIDKPAHMIWPSRYDKEGVRLKPQPISAYRAKRIVGHGQKGVAA